MIDAVDILLIEHFENRLVQFSRAIHVASKRLLEDDPRETLFIARQACAAEVLYCRHSERRRDRHIEEMVAAGTRSVHLFEFLAKVAIETLVIDIAGEILQARFELLQLLVAELARVFGTCGGLLHLW